MKPTRKIATEPPERHVSGILVTAREGALERCREEVDALPGFEVHFLYPDSGRLIAVQESADADAQEEGLRRLQAMTSVRVAALVEHRIERDDEGDGEDA